MTDASTEHDRPEQEDHAMPDDSGSATSPSVSGNGSAGAGAGAGAKTDEQSSQMQKAKKGPPTDVRRHLSCENCRIRKMRCSRTSPCLSCKMRGDECVWVGPAPNGTANEDEVEATQAEVNRLKKLVDLLLTRLEQQDSELDRYYPPVPPPAPAPATARPPSAHRDSRAVASSSRSTAVATPYDPRRPYVDSVRAGRSHGAQRYPPDADIVVEESSRSADHQRAAFVVDYVSQYPTTSSAASTSRALPNGGGGADATNSGYQSQYR